MLHFDLENDLHDSQGIRDSLSSILNLRRPNDSGLMSDLSIRQRG